mgnify:CR=1 FL=1
MDEERPDSGVWLAALASRFSVGPKHLAEPGPTPEELAQAAAERAVELTREQDGTVIDTLALVCFKRGDVGRALALQRRAVELSDVRGDPDLQRRLKLYEDAAK